MDVPSGRKFDHLDIEIVRLTTHYGFIRWNDIPLTLNSGIKSHVYVCGRDDLTDHPDLLYLIGKKIVSVVSNSELNDSRQPCLIGIPEAGRAPAQAASMVHYMLFGSSPRTICFRTMRGKLKAHGAHQRWIEGIPDHKQHQYWLTDNTITSGASVLDAVKKAASDGYETTYLKVFIVVDRQQGGVEQLRRDGFVVETAFNLLDLAFAYGKLKLWSPEKVKAVEDEVNAHQFV